MLWGVVTLDFRRPLFYPRDGQRAMDRLLDECLADDQCARTFPNVRTDLSDVIGRLDGDPLAITILDPVTKTPLPVRITRAGFAEALWIALSYPDRARKLPRIIHHAARGDFTPFLALDVATAPPRQEDPDNGAHLSVVCPEETQQVHRDELEGIPDEWFMPKGPTAAVSARVCDLGCSGVYLPLWRMASRSTCQR